jgi:site-specific recombinase XerD
VHDWLLVWRMVQAFPQSEKPFMEAFIGWLETKQFSPRSMADILRETRKLKAWMAGHGLIGLGEIGNLQLQRYLLSRACGYKHSSKQQILGRLRPLLHYYQEAVDPAYRVPDYTVKTAHLLGVNESASGEEIDRLIEALQDDELPAMAGLMLILILGYGLTLRLLPLLELTEKAEVLTYRERLPCRKGTAQRVVSLDLSVPWVANYWHIWMRERGKSPYLFSSGHGQKRMRPVSVEYCQRHVKATTQAVLGYPVAVNHLERGAIKRLARRTTLTQFMALTSELHKSRLSRMMAWLSIIER